MLWMRQETWLENGCEVGCGHLVEIGLGGKDGEKVEDIEQELTVERWQLGNQALVGANGGRWVKGTLVW